MIVGEACPNLSTTVSLQICGPPDNPVVRLSRPRNAFESELFLTPLTAGPKQHYDDQNRQHGNEGRDDAHLAAHCPLNCVMRTPRQPEPPARR